MVKHGYIYITRHGSYGYIRLKLVLVRKNLGECSHRLFFAMGGECDHHISPSVTHNK